MTGQVMLPVDFPVRKLARTELATVRIQHGVFLGYVVLHLVKIGIVSLAVRTNEPIANLSLVRLLLDVFDQVQGVQLLGGEILRTARTPKVRFRTWFLPVPRAMGLNVDGFRYGQIARLAEIPRSVVRVRAILVQEGQRLWELFLDVVQMALLQVIIHSFFRRQAQMAALADVEEAQRLGAE